MLFNSILGDSIHLSVYLICLGCACLCGLIVAFSASFKSTISKSFFVSLIVLPMIVCTIIMMVNGNLGTGVAVMGAFSLVRFRSMPGKAKDITALFLVMSAGLACAAGYVGISLLFCLIVCFVLVACQVVLSKHHRLMDLTITIPENLHFDHEFDDLFKKYFKSFRLMKIKTTNMGSLYKLTYQVEIKDETKIKACIDEIRCRNGNLEISLMECADLEGEL